MHAGLASNAARAVPFKAGNAIGEQAYALHEVVGDERFVHVQLEVAGSAAYGDGDIVAEYLAAPHGERFALGGIDG